MADTITVKLTIDEANHLIQCLDVALRQGGLGSARAVMQIFDRVEAAVRVAETASAEAAAGKPEPSPGWREAAALKPEPLSSSEDPRRDGANAWDQTDG